MDTKVPAINWKKNLFCTWIGQLLCMAGYSAIMPFIPLFIRTQYNITDDKQLGMWVSALTFFGFASFCVANPFWGVMADKFGRKLMLLRSYYISTVVFPLMYYAPSVIWLIVIRFLISFFSGSVTAAQTLIVTTTPKEHQGTALGLLSSAVWSGHMVGYLCGAFFVDKFGYKWGFMVCGALYLVGGIITHLWVEERFVRPEKNNKKSSPWKEARALPAVIWILMGIFVAVGLVRQLEAPYVPILIKQITSPEKAVFNTGIVSLLAAMGAVISGLVLGKLCDKFPPMLVAIPAVLIASVTMLIQGLTGSLYCFGAMRCLNYIAAGGLDPSFQAMLAKISPEEKRGSLFGIAASLRIVGVMLASLLGGAIIGISGSIRAVFIWTAVLFALLLPLMYLAQKFINKKHTRRKHE
ncbi:MAG: MFS transporter [Lentisphaeria bacterium]|nr:MFS transporter [Lentisphaeria bacterium]